MMHVLMWMDCCTGSAHRLATSVPTSFKVDMTFNSIPRHMALAALWWALSGQSSCVQRRRDLPHYMIRDITGPRNPLTEMGLTENEWACSTLSCGPALPRKPPTTLASLDGKDRAGTAKPAGSMGTCGNGTCRGRCDGAHAAAHPSRQRPCSPPSLE